MKVADFYLTEVELNVIKTNLECLEVIGFSLFDTQVVADEEAAAAMLRSDYKYLTNKLELAIGYWVMGQMGSHIEYFLTISFLENYGGRSSSKSLSTMKSTKGQSLKRALEASGEATTSKRRKITFMVKYRDNHKRVLEGSESTTIADIVGFVNEKYPHLPKINLVYEDNGEKFVLDDDFNITMEESKDADVIINV
ncbi:hypothetical protein Tco_1269350 [Tanacetum coccineum]